jgi:hypothetical protein
VKIIFYENTFNIGFISFLLFLMMRTYYGLIFFLISVSFYQCTAPVNRGGEKLVDTEPRVAKDTFHLLCQYWQLTDAEKPTSADVSFTNDKGILFQSGIVFMTDSVLLENPTGEMKYGKFTLNGNIITSVFDNGSKAIYQIGRLNDNELWLKRTMNKHTTQLVFKATHTYWKDAGKNPFAKQNYQWSIKPLKPENDTALRKRVKENVQFYAYYFNGFIAGHATTINFEAIPCCLKWYSGGIFIQNEDKLDKKWSNCFYSEEQAFQARQILEDALHKKYDWDTTQTNWVKQIAPVLQQISDGL